MPITPLPPLSFPPPFIWMAKAYSPSSGNTWRAAKPPWVPNGMSSLMRASCVSNPSEYTWRMGRLSGPPTAARLILVAAAV